MLHSALQRRATVPGGTTALSVHSHLPPWCSPVCGASATTPTAPAGPGPDRRWTDVPARRGLVNSGDACLHLYGPPSTREEVVDIAAWCAAVTTRSLVLTWGERPAKWRCIETCLFNGMVPGQTASRGGSPFASNEHVRNLSLGLRLGRFDDVFLRHTLGDVGRAFPLLMTLRLRAGGAGTSGLRSA
jgi:hypothetical protein